MPSNDDSAMGEGSRASPNTEVPIGHDPRSQDADGAQPGFGPASQTVRPFGLRPGVDCDPQPAHERGTDGNHEHRARNESGVDHHRDAHHQLREAQLLPPIDEETEAHAAYEHSGHHPTRGEFHLHTLHIGGALVMA
ncbi:MAG: hypothetical protein ACI835_004992 [Planctomycetota bacterium]|jgi:hypothetical protein